VATTAYTINSTTVCVLQIPRGTAGKTLLVGFFVSANTSQGFYIADGAPMRRVIRR
jgi:hypothetical protein